MKFKELMLKAALRGVIEPVKLDLTLRVLAPLNCH